MSSQIPDAIIKQFYIVSYYCPNPSDSDSARSALAARSRCANK